MSTGPATARIEDRSASTSDVSDSHFASRDDDGRGIPIDAGAPIDGKPSCPRSRSTASKGDDCLPIRDVAGHSISDLISLSNRRAVITGGARGIGRAIAARFAEAGAEVALADVRRDEAETAAAEISARFGRRVVAVGADVTSPESVAALADQAEARLGHLHIWVNNAARPLVKPFLETSEAEWRALLDVNLLGYVWGCQTAARRMVAAGHGRIVNVSSAADVQPLADLAAYMAAGK